MNKLKGPLTISHLENVDSVEKALSVSLKSKIGIDSLCFEWSSLNDACDVGGDDGETVAKILDALEPSPKGLITLSLVNYRGERVPTWMSKLRFLSLQNLKMDGLPYMVRVLDVELPSLKSLKIENCSMLRVVSMGLPNLMALYVSGCQELTTLLCMIPPLQSFSYASEIPSLLEIQIINCPGLVPFQDKGLPPMLHLLEVESCTTLRHLPKGLQHNTLLHSLRIRDCSDLVSFPDEGLPPVLQRLEIKSCKNLGHLPRGLQHNTSLLSLQIEHCPELVSFPEEGIPPMLQHLSIRKCTNLRHLPTSLHDLTSVKTLELAGCPELRIMSDDQLPPNLRPHIFDCPKLEQQLER